MNREGEGGDGGREGGRVLCLTRLISPTTWWIGLTTKDTTFSALKWDRIEGKKESEGEGEDLLCLIRLIPPTTWWVCRTTKDTTFSIKRIRDRIEKEREKMGERESELILYFFLLFFFFVTGTNPYVLLVTYEVCQDRDHVETVSLFFFFLFFFLFFYFFLLFIYLFI
jgi:hypothetical protein